jgi:hypothetical protein
MEADDVQMKKFIIEAVVEEKVVLLVEAESVEAIKDDGDFNIIDTLKSDTLDELLISVREYEEEIHGS